MPDEQDQQVTVRRLPGGDVHEGILFGLQGQLLRIGLAAVPSGASLKTGDLVEVCCEKTLYLGEVHSQENETTVIGIEHAFDRETLALIQQIWHGPAGL